MKKNIPLAAIATIIASILLYSCGGHDKVEVVGGYNESESAVPNPTLNIYLENSGSMDGYMCEGSQLKDAVYDYVSDLNRYSEKINLFYINNRPIEYKGGLNAYIKDLRPASFKAAGGDRRNSELGNILDSIVSHMSDNTVSILISDCILDIPAMDSQKYLTNCQIQIKNAIVEGQKRIKNFSVEILRMTSDFKGNYYYQNGKVEALDSVQRPYFIWILGNKGLLAQYNKENPLSDLSKHGMTNLAAFTDFSEVPFQVKNQYLTSNVIKSIRGDFKATLQANMLPTLQPESTILDAFNYSFSAQGIAIDRIDPIKAENSPYSYSFQVSVPADTHVSDVLMRFDRPTLPVWVSELNDETGNDIRNNIEKTTGIKSLIQGVADAYKKETTLTSFKFTFKTR